MGGCRITSKMVMALIGLVFWGAAAALMFAGGYVFKTYGHYEHITEAKYTLVPAIIAMAVGLGMFIMGVLSCCGACQTNRCLLATLFGLLLVILALLITAGVLGYVYKDMLKNTFHGKVDEALQNYSDDNTELRNEVDYMQIELKCCGGYNYTDWIDTPWYAKHNAVPPSCCIQPSCNTSPTVEPLQIYTMGCLEKLEEEFRDHLGYIIGLAIGIVTLLVLGLISSCVLFWQKKEIPYTTLVSGYSV